MIHIGGSPRARSVFSEAALCLGEEQVDPENELKPYHDRFEDLDVHEPSTWKATVVSCVMRLKCAKLAIVSTVAVTAMTAYKSLPPTTTAEALIAIVVLGIFGSIHGS